MVACWRFGSDVYPWEIQVMSIQSEPSLPTREQKQYALTYGHVKLRHDHRLRHISPQAALCPDR
jgi:hypothetical protein